MSKAATAKTEKTEVLPPATAETEVLPPASISERALAAVKKGPEIRVLKQVTYPLLKQRDNETAYVEIVGAFFLGKKLDDKKDAATLVHVKTPGNEGVFQFIVPAVMQSELDKAYPEASYVGHKFAVQKFKPEDGKRYNTFSILEVEWD